MITIDTPSGVKPTLWTLALASTLAWFPAQEAAADVTAEPAPAGAPRVNSESLQSIPVSSGESPSGSVSNQTMPRDNVLLEEVVVTAQKREENAQSVPVAIKAFTGEQLEVLGIANTRDLTRVTPGLQFTEQAGYTLIYLRGIGTDAFLSNADPSVATYVDGLYIPAQQGLITDLAGVERVEVLKGPQGTLFGRNSTAGAINVITKTPGQFAELDLQQDIANRGTYRTALYSSLPMTDSLAVSVSGIYRTTNPYFHLEDNPCLLCSDPPSDLKAESTYGGKLKLRWNPVDNLDVLLGAYFLKQSTPNGSQMAQNTNPSLLGIATGYKPPSDDYEISRNEKTRATTENRAFYANITWSLPFADLKTIVGRQLIQTENSRYDYDGTRRPLVTFYSNNQPAYLTTAEFQIASNDASWRADQFKWVGGFYYYHSRAGFKPLDLSVGGTGVPVLPNLGLLTPDQVQQLISALPLLGNIPGIDLTNASVNLRVYGFLETNSYSEFAQGTYDFADWFGLTLGLRYQQEDRSLPDQRTTLRNDGGSELPVFQWHAPKVSNDNTSYKVSLNFKPTEDVLFYLTTARGYKSGTYNATAIYTPPNYVLPETVYSYEAGVKSQLLNGSLRLNAAAFQSNLNNLQTIFVSLTNGGAITFENAGKARSRGVEFDAVWVPLRQLDPGLAVTAGASLIDAIYTDYKNASGFNETTGLFQQNLDFTGNQIARSPRTSGNIGLNQAIDFGAGESTVDLGVDAYFNGGFYFTAQNLESARQKAYYLFNARAGYTYNPWRLSATLFAENLADRRHIASSFTEDFGTFTTYAPPRLYGVKMKWNWGA